MTKTAKKPKTAKAQNKNANKDGVVYPSRVTKGGHIKKGDVFKLGAAKFTVAGYTSKKMNTIRLTDSAGKEQKVSIETLWNDYKRA